MAKEESPTLEGTDPEVTDAGTTEDKVDVDALVSMLESANISTPAELENKLVASREAGQLAYQLGEMRKEVDRLKNKPAPKAPDNDFDSFGDKPIDIETALEGAVEKVLSKREQKAAEQQRQNMLTWTKIQSHPYWEKVKDIFQQRMQAPEMMTKLSGGQTDTLTEFYNTVIDFQGGVIKKAAGTVKAWKGENKQPATPELESGEARVSVNTPEAKAEKDKKIEGFKVKVDKGALLTDIEEMEALDAILGP